MRSNDPVRLFLESAGQYEAEASRRRQRAKELEYKCSRLTAQMDSMPGGGGKDQNDLLAAWADARTKEVEAIRRAEEQRAQVEDLLAHIKTPVYREILLLRYISLYSWQDVRKKLRRAGYYYSERQVFRLHNEAVDAAAEIFEKMESLQ